MDVFELLRHKETEVTRLTKEIDALRIVADLMVKEAGATGSGNDYAPPRTAAPRPAEPAPATASQGGKSLWP